MNRFFQVSHIKKASRALCILCAAAAFLLVVSPMPQPVLPANGTAIGLTEQQQAVADLCQIDALCAETAVNRTDCAVLIAQHGRQRSIHTLKINLFGFDTDLLVIHDHTDQVNRIAADIPNASTAK